MEIANHGPATAAVDGFEVIVPEHPLIRHWVSVLRNRDTPSQAFRSAMGELGRLLLYEATRDWLPTVAREVQSPMGPAVVESVNYLEPIIIVPILRAGLALAELATSILPSTRTFHLGMARDERTLQPYVYLNKLPDRFPKGCHILLMDPMLATGGTVAAAVDLLKDHGAEISQIRIISAVAAPLALRKLHNKFPGICVYAGAMDQTVNEKGFIVPGLGDAGDRSYGT
ncbi:uracil phosphoribosyltransferase-like [Oryza brachyantha]|uniref:uracil phosphoribosyltransferase n=1 Tax=Oryza brachyantha TaxID=4533 RepID=J3M5G2_ORYBR|nr:uracil phosphoribosyltransferase-like [Oryza brachyantha]